MQDSNSNQTKKIFADRLQDLIADSGKKIDVLAGEIGIAAGTLSAYQNATTEAGIAKLKKIADYFGVSCDYLLGEAENKTIKNEEIRKRLGLSDGAIEALEDAKRDEFKIDCMFAFNFLLGHQKLLGIKFINDIAHYIVLNHKMDLDSPESNFVSFENGGGIDIGGMVNAAFKNAIDDDLRVARGNFQSSMPHKAITYPKKANTEKGGNR